MIAIATKNETYKVEKVNEFEDWVQDRADMSGKRFEFLRGEIVEKPSLSQSEFYIPIFLTRLFTKTKAYQGGAELLTEAEVYVSDNCKRVADLAYFTSEQLQHARSGKKIAAIFAIEILASNESLFDVIDKVEDYFLAGAKLVWYISPKHQQVFYYTSPTSLKIMKGDTLCSAEPILPDFAFSVKEMFL